MDAPAEKFLKGLNFMRQKDQNKPLRCFITLQGIYLLNNQKTTIVYSGC